MASSLRCCDFTHHHVTSVLVSTDAYVHLVCWCAGDDARSTGDPNWLNDNGFTTDDETGLYIARWVATVRVARSSMASRPCAALGCNTDVRIRPGPTDLVIASHLPRRRIVFHPCCSLYFICSTFVSLGLGDIHPAGDTERVSGTLVVLVWMASVPAAAAKGADAPLGAP